jgi:hypothetical protein
VLSASSAPPPTFGKRVTFGPRRAPASSHLRMVSPQRLGRRAPTCTRGASCRGGFSPFARPAVVLLTRRAVWPRIFARVFETAAGRTLCDVLACHAVCGVGFHTLRCIRPFHVRHCEMGARSFQYVVSSALGRV